MGLKQFKFIYLQLQVEAHLCMLWLGFMGNIHAHI